MRSTFPEGIPEEEGKSMEINGKEIILRNESLGNLEIAWVVVNVDQFGFLSCWSK